MSASSIRTLSLSCLGRTRLPLPPARVRQGVRHTLNRLGVRSYRLSVVFVPDALMHRLNRRYTGHRGLTDVLAFELGDNRRLLEGEIVIAPSLARENAAIYDQTVAQELMTYVIHGLLHLLGYRDDTPRARQRMWRVQERLVRKLRI